jgi:hypothetical protein
MDLSVSRVRNAKKLLHFHPYQTPLVYKLRRTDREARAYFVNWCLHGVHAGEIDTSLGQFSDEAWFQPTE